jgi:hypothetical protein
MFLFSSSNSVLVPDKRAAICGFGGLGPAGFECEGEYEFEDEYVPSYT